FRQLILSHLKFKLVGASNPGQQPLGGSLDDRVGGITCRRLKKLSKQAIRITRKPVSQRNRIELALLEGSGLDPQKTSPRPDLTGRIGGHVPVRHDTTNRPLAS